jgi:hypothetical protein
LRYAREEIDKDDERRKEINEEGKERRSDVTRMAVIAKCRKQAPTLSETSLHV